MLNDSFFKSFFKSFFLPLSLCLSLPAIAESSATSHSIAFLYRLGHKDLKTPKDCKVAYNTFKDVAPLELDRKLRLAKKAAATKGFHIMAQKPSVHLWGYIYEKGALVDVVLLYSDFDTLHTKTGKEAQALIKKVTDHCRAKLGLD